MHFAYFDYQSVKTLKRENERNIIGKVIGKVTSCSFLQSSYLSNIKPTITLNRASCDLVDVKWLIMFKSICGIPDLADTALISV